MNFHEVEKSTGPAVSIMVHLSNVHWRTSIEGLSEKVVEVTLLKIVGSAFESRFKNKNSQHTWLKQIIFHCL